MSTHRLPEEWIDRRHPIDSIEPEIHDHSAYREAGQKFVRVMNAAFAHIESALLRPGSTKKDIMVAFYQPAYALGLNICDGVSVTERADKLGVKRATLSKGMTAFCNGNDIPPSPYMKGEEAAKSYHNARIESIRAHGLN